MSQSNLEGKTILITGASGGIGQACALECFQAKANLILTYNSNKQKLDDFIKAHQINATLVQMDIEDPQDITNKFKSHSDVLGSVYGLVNCSGVNIGNPLISLSDDDIFRQINVNLTGSIVLTREACKIMIRKRHGSIVHLGSVSAHRMVRGHSVYSAAKAGLEGFVKALASEVAKRNIRVNCVLPGPVMSDMLKKSLDQTGDNPADRVPMQRLIEASEVAKSCRFLLSEDASAITGAMVPVDGGYLLW